MGGETDRILDMTHLDDAQKYEEMTSDALRFLSTLAQTDGGGTSTDPPASDSTNSTANVTGPPAPTSTCAVPRERCDRAGGAEGAVDCDP